jgi:DNA adenine methylase
MAKRLKKVTIENDDWETILSTYDSPDMVFYLDPPYIQTQVGTYKHNLTMFDHKRLLDKIFTLKGSAYLSGYHHEMIDSYPWDEVHEWDQKSFLAATGTASNAKEERPDKVEVLWVKK